MPLKDTEKIAVGMLRQTLQEWLVPQLSDMSKRLAHIESDIVKIDSRFETINTRIDGLEKRMEDRFETINTRIDGLEKRMEDRFETINSRIDGVEKRMEDGFGALNKRIDDVNARLDSGLGAINARLGDLHDSLKIHERLARLEAEHDLKRETSA
jgi:tetrahydromethanopterin S-methyltransferase subunit G